MIHPSLSELSKWVRFRSIAYLQKKGLIFGSTSEIFPVQAAATGVFPIYCDVENQPRVAAIGEDFSIFAPSSFNYVFVGPRLNTTINPTQVLQDLVSKLARNGHFVVFLPIIDVGDEDLFRELIGSMGGWMCKASYVKEADGRKYFLQIYKKLKTNHGVCDRVSLTTKPKVCIIRYGALGDMIMLTPLIRKLHEDGYHITLNITSYAAEVLKFNPYVDNLILQEKDAIPNPTLGEYWNIWKPEYDRYINLSESIEGSLLKVEGRRDFYTTAAWRRAYCNHNYYDFTMQLGGYETCVGRRGELYFSAAEEREAKQVLDQHRGKFRIVWALNGSSHHKYYALFEPVVRDFLDSHPNVVVFTVGDIRAKNLEFDHPRLVRLAGTQSLRITLAMTKIADLVIGPESVVINAAGCFDTPKICLLSHSSRFNLCNNFVNDYSLEPSLVQAPCYPCHQLHYTRESCPLVDVLSDDVVIGTGPACAMGAISGEVLAKRIEEVMSAGLGK